MDVDIELFPLPKPMLEVDLNGNRLPCTFNVTKFFADIITYDSSEAGISNLLEDFDGQRGRLMDLMKRVKQKEFKKRA